MRDIRNAYRVLVGKGEDQLEDRGINGKIKIDILKFVIICTTVITV